MKFAVRQSRRHNLTGGMTSAEQAKTWVQKNGPAWDALVRALSEIQPACEALAASGGTSGADEVVRSSKDTIDAVGMMQGAPPFPNLRVRNDLRTALSKIRQGVTAAALAVQANDGPGLVAASKLMDDANAALTNVDDSMARVLGFRPLGYQ